MQSIIFYAVTNGKEVGVFTNRHQAGDLVLRYANAQYKRFVVYSDSAGAMLTAGYKDDTIFDGTNSFSRKDYEQKRQKHASKTNPTTGISREPTTFFTEYSTYSLY